MDLFERDEVSNVNIYMCLYLVGHETLKGLMCSNIHIYMCWV